MILKFFAPLFFKCNPKEIGQREPYEKRVGAGKAHGFTLQISAIHNLTAQVYIKVAVKYPYFVYKFPFLGVGF